MSKHKHVPTPQACLNGQAVIDALEASGKVKFHPGNGSSHRTCQNLETGETLTVHCHETGIGLASRWAKILKTWGILMIVPGLIGFIWITWFCPESLYQVYLALGGA